MPQGPVFEQIQHYNLFGDPNYEIYIRKEAILPETNTLLEAARRKTKQKKISMQKCDKAYQTVTYNAEHQVLIWY